MSEVVAVEAILNVGLFILLCCPSRCPRGYLAEHSLVMPVFTSAIDNSKQRQSVCTCRQPVQHERRIFETTPRVTAEIVWGTCLLFDSAPGRLQDNPCCR